VTVRWNLWAVFLLVANICSCLLTFFLLFVAICENTNEPPEVPALTTTSPRGDLHFLTREFTSSLPKEDLGTRGLGDPNDVALSWCLLAATIISGLFLSFFSRPFKSLQFWRIIPGDATFGIFIETAKTFPGFWLKGKSCSTMGNC